MQIYLVHRWDGNPDSDWYPWLKKQLENKGINIIIPKMPDNPEIDKWVGILRKKVKNLDKNTYFIGHSIGCQTIMRYLQTLQDNIEIGGLIFVAGWFRLQNLEDEEVEEMVKPWLEDNIDFSKIKNKTKNISAIFSTNDKYVDFEENSKLFRDKLNAKIIKIKDKGHFTSEDNIIELHEILKEL